MLEHFTKEVIEYCENHTIKPDEVLDRIEASTRENSNQANMLSGAYQGSLLRMLSRLIQPERVLEVGTYTGYSAICLAEGLKADGELVSLEKDESRRDLIEEHLSWTPLGKKVRVLYGDAKDILPTLSDTFDLVFIDAAKREYGIYYEESIKRMRSGGLMIIDNVLWRGKVVSAEPDKKTKSIQQFNDMVAGDDRVHPFLLPIRDGVYLVQKR